MGGMRYVQILHMLLLDGAIGDVKMKVTHAYMQRCMPRQKVQINSCSMTILIHGHFPRRSPSRLSALACRSPVHAYIGGIGNAAKNDP